MTITNKPKMRKKGEDVEELEENINKKKKKGDMTNEGLGNKRREEEKTKEA